MTLLEKYQSFLVNNTRPEFEPVSLDLSADGWKLLIRENLTPLIEEKLQMCQMSDYVWASDYQDGRRKVFSLFKLNAAATFQWGWNFDFVPRVIRGNRVAWARTDKSIYTHIYELSADFYDTGYVTIKKKMDARKKTIISRDGIDIKNLEKGLAERIEQHKAVFYYLLPLVTEYYQATASYEGILKRIEQNLQNGYYRFINGDSAISYVFVEKRMGMHEKALRDFETIPFRGENIKAKFFECFKRLGGGVGDRK